MSFMKQLNFSAVAPKAEPPKAKPAKESAAAEAPAPKKKEKAEKKAQPAAAATATAAPAVSKAAPAAASPEKKEKAKPGKKEREAAKAAAAAAPLKASASSSSAPEQAAPAPTNDWKAERERKMAAEREAKIAAISQAAAAPPKAKAAGAKKGGASKGEQRLLFAPAPHWSTTPLPTLPAAPASEKKSKKGKEAAAPAFPSDEQVASLHAQGKALLEADNRTYSELMSSGTSIAGGGLGTLSSSDAKFISSLLSGGGAGTGAGGGTLSDRIAALTLLVQSSPLHNMHSMESLLSMASKKGREESGRATRALGDWLASAGGLGARKLRYFRDQPMLPAVAALQGASSADATAAVQGHLILYAFEDALKHFYFSFLQLLEAQTHDTLPFVRKQAVTQTYVLLRDKSEQEQNLLRLLVNKLGDSERAVASKASGHLLELLATHPAMKAVVVREVAQLVLRPPPKVAPTAAKDGEPAVAKYNTHARYYGVLTLNQTLLTARDDAVAANLVHLYFELFESVLQDFQKSTGGKEETIADAEAAAAAAEEEGGAAGAGKKDKKGRWRDQKGKKGKGGKANKAGANDENKAVVDADAKMMAAILTGVRRAFPFAKLDTEM
jgi:ribosome biogenesis protein MAK21